MRAQRAAVTPLPVRDRGAGVTSRIRTSGPAGPEPGPDVTAIGRVEVPPGVAEQAGARDPAPVAEDLVGSEPRLRVVAVHVGGEARIGPEIVGHPFPHVADHLAAAESAVAVGEGAHVGAPARAPVEVRALWGRRIVPPGEPPLPRGEAAPAGARLQRGRRFPLRLGGQAAPGPRAVGLGLVPAHVDDGPVRLEPDPAVEVAAMPAHRVATPVHGVRGLDARAPPPPTLAPQLAPRVAS